VSCAYLVYCVSRILFGMSLNMDVRCATYNVRLAWCINAINHAMHGATIKITNCRLFTARYELGL